MLHAASKWAAVAVASALVPVAVGIMRRYPRTLGIAIATAGFLPFIGLSHFSINLISYAQYRGDSRGLEVTTVDFLMAALFFLLKPSMRATPYRRTRLLYLAAVVLSIGAAQVPLYSLFGLWKLLRMYAVVVVLSKACEDPDLSPRLLSGMSCGICLEATLCLYQHYVLHVYQAPGNFEHQNTLTMACNLITPVAFAILLARPGRAALATVMASALCVVLGLSRGSLGAFAAALLAVYILSLARGATWRIVGAGAVGGVAALALALKVYRTVRIRFLSAPVTSLEGRLLFENAAAAMLHDHPWGIGINQFSDTLLRFGYGEKVGLGAGDQSGIVHNIYWLTAAELGYAGLAAYLLMIAVPVWLAIRWARRTEMSDIRGPVLLGCAVGLLIVHAQGLLEWLARQTAFSYLYWMIAALISGMTRQMARERERSRS